MKRRKIINQVAVGAASFSLAACKSESRFRLSTSEKIEQPTLEWQMATSWPITLKNTLYGGVEALCNRISELTDGRLKITPHPADEITPALEVLDAVQNEKVECGHTAGYYYLDKNPALAFSTSIPFGLNFKQQSAWLQAGGGLELIRSVYADFNVINFPAGSTGNQMGGWFKQEITTPADLTGLKMRLPGLGGQVMQRLGVEIKELPPAELVTALEKGDIDAAEWTSPVDDEQLGLNQAAQFYYYPGWQEPGVTFDLIVNQNAFAQLPKNYQQAIYTASLEANATILALYENLNAQALPRLLNNGTKLVAFSPEILTAASQKTFEILEEYASKNSSFKKIYEQWKSFRQEIYQWHSIDELSYNQFVFNT